MGTSSDAVSPEAVGEAAGLADLPLTKERTGEVAALLSAWLPAANALSSRMRAEDLGALIPAVVFTQGSADTDTDTDEEVRA